MSPMPKRPSRTRVRPAVDRPERVEFLASLDAAGWVSYTHRRPSWSMRHPARWRVEEQSRSGVSFRAGMPDLGVIAVQTVEWARGDAAPTDTGSADYLRGIAWAGVMGGWIHADFDASLWIDRDCDGEAGPHDIHGANAFVAMWEGALVPRAAELPTAWWAFYDPAVPHAFAMKSVVIAPATESPEEQARSLEWIEEYQSDIYAMLASFDPYRP